MNGNSSELISRLMNARSVVVLTGAGISAASGVPTFRGEGGLWKNYRPEELATPSAFLRDAGLVWEWYLWRRDLISQVKPNPGHQALVELENLVPDCAVITQNVDNLHQDSGSRKVIELHGNIMRNKCFECGKMYQGEVKSDAIPHCPECGGLIRPDVVWFGEPLPEHAIREAHQYAGKCDVFLIVGTSGIVEPAASIPFIARSANAYLAEFNLNSTPISEICDETFFGEADKKLPEIIGDFKKRKRNLS